MRLTVLLVCLLLSASLALKVRSHELMAHPNSQCSSYQDCVDRIQKECNEDKWANCPKANAETCDQPLFHERNICEFWKILHCVWERKEVCANKARHVSCFRRQNVWNGNGFWRYDLDTSRFIWTHTKPQMECKVFE